MNNTLRVDEAQAAYWNSPVTRNEVQNVLDEYAQATIALKTQVVNIEFALAYIVEKLGITPEDITQFMTRKLAEFANSGATQAAQAKSSVTLN